MSLETESEIAAAIATTKFCKDCKWHEIPIGSAAKYAECSAPQNMLMQINVVTGEPERVSKYAHCSTLRIGKEDCGRDANWFVQADIRQAVTS